VTKKEQLLSVISGKSLKDAAKNAGVNYPYAVRLVKQWHESGVIVYRRSGRERILERVGDDVQMV